MSEAKRTPLYEEHVALGARMVDFAGWDMPVQYAGIIEEHKAVRERVGIFDVSHMAEFRFFGFEAKDALQRIVANDLGKIDELGTAVYTVMCDADGGIIDDLIVYHTGDLEYLIIANASNRETDWDWITSHLPEQGVEAADESDRTALIAIQGSLALRVVGELAGEDWEPPARFSIAEAVLDTIPALVARTGYTGEDGVEVLCHASQAAALWRALLSFPEVTPCGLGARDTLRLEMGYALYGSDMDRGVDPVSAGLGWTLGLSKGEFIGREAIVRIKETGPQSKLVGITVSEGVPRHGYSVLHEGTEVGKVASGTYSPTLEHGIATAYVPVSLASPGTELQIAIRRKTVAAVVTRPPFVKTTSLNASAS
ncbi:MAG: glycine cleavage system aminomethyltransferase GcvT [Coriobacteriia bacterium]|nr:glycine cleavage system aminomethyltransferase GcvT [Coriobacteriia bacterium]MBN2821806.1 glycine cleavage system aminomethyltransferase GcvT [Coriobacteriia bacterium]